MVTFKLYACWLRTNTASLRHAGDNRYITLIVCRTPTKDSLSKHVFKLRILESDPRLKQASTVDVPQHGFTWVLSGNMQESFALLKMWSSVIPLPYNQKPPIQIVFLLFISERQIYDGIIIWYEGRTEQLGFAPWFKYLCSFRNPRILP
jgi:hypothetical protein